jgi:ABC-type sulfate/molybdate transport systems ATPase subunit
MTDLRVESITKVYNSNAGVENVSFTLQQGKWGGIIGPTGSGKTTLLKVVAGIEKPDSGQVILGNHVVNNWATQERRMVLVWQELMVFDHLTVEENITFALKLKQTTPENLCDLFHLDRQLLRRKANQISGGERQRIALARAYAANPQVLLLDEPFGQQDIYTREAIVEQLFELKSRSEHTLSVLLVSHDQDEVFAVSDWVLVLERGRVVGEGTPKEILTKPRNRAVAALVGENNIFTGFVEDGSCHINIGDQKVAIEPSPEQVSPDLGWPPKEKSFHAILASSKLKLADPGGHMKMIRAESTKMATYKASFSSIHFRIGEETLKVLCSFDEYALFAGSSPTELYFRQGDLWLVPK